MVNIEHRNIINEILRIYGSNYSFQTLRDQYVFKLVPMLNPDGVIVGNYRTSLSGVDLNRVYKSPLPDIFPTVFHTKKMMENFIRERKVVVWRRVPQCVIVGCVS